MFDIREKVALITGGASGIGLECSKELLRSGAKGVTLADVSSERGNQALKEIEEEFGPNKVIFVQTDVTKDEEFERAFEETVAKFNNIDILFNNAGICNDIEYKKEIEINFTGTVTGCILAIERYLPKYKQGDEGVVINISSVAGTENVFGSMPVYAATKNAVFGLTRAWGFPELCALTKVKVIALCPGMTLTPMVVNCDKGVLGESYRAMLKTVQPLYSTQQPEYVAKEAMEVLKYAPTGTSWVIEGGEPAYRYETPDRTTMKNNQLIKAINLDRSW